MLCRNIPVIEHINKYSEHLQKKTTHTRWSTKLLQHPTSGAPKRALDQGEVVGKRPQTLKMCR